MSNGNREYKSDVFSMLMEDSNNALSVYNALNDTNYTNPDDVEVHTLEKGVSLTVRNDAAFVVDAALSIYEHQSTVCPNMPVRSLIYYTIIISKIIKNKNNMEEVWLRFRFLNLQCFIMAVKISLRNMS